MALRLMAVLAHPDDESLGFGGTLATYAAAGVETFLVMATRGEAGRCGEHRRGTPGHPGPEALAGIREAELRAAAAILGIGDIAFLDYRDQELDRADHGEVVARIVHQLRRTRPDVVLTFGQDGAYGHPDHIAICQQATAAVAVAADPSFVSGDGDRPHRVAKLYYIAWPASTWAAYEDALQKLVSVVDGVERQAVPWPDWSITTVIDTRAAWETVWRAVSCHASQMAIFEGLKDLSPMLHQALWGSQSFYRVLSTVNGGRQQETDLFEGIRD
ncbi:MAG: PIG-L family deacetylase [Vicinamibacteraceae bacterium]